MRSRIRGSSAAVVLLMLAACSTPGQRPNPAVPPAPVATLPASKPSSPASAAEKPSPAPVPANLWSRMRARFALPGCDADPRIVFWARRYTRNSAGFERYLQEVTPTIAYVEGAAEHAHIPAEFSLLPWVESRYRASPAKGRRSAGMWQIVPITARHLHLPMERDYDARLDRIVSTRAVMHMLSGYARRWHDWRLVDMAYNAGPNRIGRLHPSGPAPAQPLVPDLAVSHITRDHLLKLLAIACVIREPQRFGVQLPAPDKERRLVEIDLPFPATLDAVARAAHVPLRRIRRLNAAYLHGRMPGAGPWHVLLPAYGAARLDEALAQHQLPRQPAVHTVRPGESLWSIARHYSLDVRQLRRMNHLHGNLLHPGQVLRVQASR